MNGRWLFEPDMDISNVLVMLFRLFNALTNFQALLSAFRGLIIDDFCSLLG